MKKVLVVDDEPFILMMIEEKLKRAGYGVTVSRRSEGILDVIRKERPDLIILDWMMPGPSGIEVCRQIKSDPEISSIPIFMLTAKGRQEDERVGLGCGADRFITKPFSPKLLLLMVQEFLGDK
ncbi:MAG: response regulator transcription factor [Thermodesulfovibrionales bacterium]